MSEANFKENHWALLDLQYEYLDDGFKLIATTDVPCHLFCRMTTTPPRKHTLPTSRRGIYFQGDIRFCFVVYEDNEQDEAGDTYIHTFNKSAWPVCETRWFYFVGEQNGTRSVSETSIFKFHFPAPPPEPPPPILRVFFPQDNNRTIQSNAIGWPACWGGAALSVLNNYAAPNYALMADTTLTASYWIRRVFLTFDTTPLPDTARILSASLSVWPFFARRTASAANPYLQITSGYQSDPVIPANWTIQNTETTVLGQIDYAALVTGAYNIIQLNVEGCARIKLNDITKYCLRAELDVLNISPALGGNQCWFYSAQKGAGYRPTLSILYYPA